MTDEQSLDENSTLTVSLTKRVLPYLFLLPSFVLMISFVYFPIFFALLLSFYENPTLPEISSNLLGYFRDKTNLNMISLSQFFSNLLAAGFLPLFHAMTITLSTIFGVGIIGKFVPHLSKTKRFIISLSLSSIISSYLLIFIINFFIGNGSSWLVPLGNYDQVFSSELIIGDFLRILLNTFLWATICTFFHVVFGILLAIMMNRHFPGRNVFRAFFILPWAIPSFITALVWRNFIFNEDRGVLGRWASDNVTPGSSVLITYLDLLLFLLAIILLGWIISSFKETTPKQKTLQAIGLVAMVTPLIIEMIIGQNLLVGVGMVGDRAIEIYDIKNKFFFTSDLYFLGFETKTIFLAAIITNIWLGIPFMMMSFLATLQSISGELYEAAKLEGASNWILFKDITFPNLIPTLRTVALLGIIWTFNLFNVFYILSQNQTGLGRRENYDIFITYIYYLIQNGPRGAPEFAAGAALSFVVFLILVLFSKAYQRTFPEEE
ncbi:MAG: sugar ABC transporter permease [Methanobacteriota archaeon]|nr:MAG: sugar ABC transporter permease [Euryarchaeota archaeon]